MNPTLENLVNEITEISSNQGGVIFDQEIAAPTTEEKIAAARSAAINALEITPVDCIRNSSKMATSSMLQLAHSLLKDAAERQVTWEGGHDGGEVVETGNYTAINEAAKAALHAIHVAG